MPGIEPTAPQTGSTAEGELRFPPVTRDHILHCSYDFWFPKYRTSCIRSRIIPLTPEFISYLRQDGIILADEGPDKTDDDGLAASDDEEDDWEPSFPTSAYPPPPRDDLADDDSDSESDTEEDTSASTRRQPPNRLFPALHAEITSAIASLGGAAAPKLNWSSPKDATFISRHPNTMKCTSANDVYILLKSSSFISHDLDHAFDDTPVLVLRTFFNPLPSLEFRCFVKDRNLIAITQRDLNYYAFLPSLRGQIIARASELFKKMRFTFPDRCFVFDVYIPEADDDCDEYDEDGKKKVRLGRARLIDINPWAPRTDTLLFDWAELLEKRVSRPLFGSASSDVQEGATDVDEEEEDDEEEETDEPELRLVEQDDPAAYNFSSPQYSAHKLPKDVVDASLGGEGGIREFAQRWQRITGGR
ncbi:D123-domain-containing protein [Achaetomium macrosporum]|uniref:D123-domain-containing protein n=1 Tax=Achaetomium macrosporum TaxID=79813 RepID=A0AAN7CDF1_9PEZI|nr:D123-domain-containing protein [Achaetomium macrosporum]